MDNRYIDNVIAEIKPLFDEQGFAKCEDGSYKNDKKAVKIEYDEKRQSYILLMADVNEDEKIEFAEITAWLFDDGQTEKDAATVGMDFCDTVRTNLGIKIVKPSDAQVDLPTFSKDGAYNVTAFSKKVLDIYPDLKDTYKAHVAKYGNFLYLDFFGENLVPRVKATVDAGNAKANKKLFEMFENAYINGDKDVVNTLVAIISAAGIENDEAKAKVLEFVSGDDHLKMSVESFIPVLQKNAKLKQALIK